MKCHDKLIRASASQLENWVRFSCQLTPTFCERLKLRSHTMKSYQLLQNTLVCFIAYVTTHTALKRYNVIVAIQ